MNDEHQCPQPTNRNPSNASEDKMSIRSNDETLGFFERIGNAIRSARAATLSAAVIVISACSDGNKERVNTQSPPDSGDQPADPDNAVDPASTESSSTDGTQSPVEPDTPLRPEQQLDIAIEQAKASRFMQIAGLAADSTGLSDVIAEGNQAWLERQLTMRDSGTRFGWMMDNGFGTGHTSAQTVLAFHSATWRRLFTARNQVIQRWALALSEIFVINASETPNLSNLRGFAGASYMDMLEANCLGNFRDLIEEITLSSQMGRYLTLANSKKAGFNGRAPDENYAREILQLFSIGLYELNATGSVKTDSAGNPIETYTNDDVIEIARALTGWTYVTDRATADWHRERMVQAARTHDTGEQTFLGVTIPAGTDGETALSIVLDTIANHPNVGPFLSDQFIKRLVTSNPSPAYIERVSSVYDNDGTGSRGNLKAVLKAILLDEEALDESPQDTNVQGKLREPMLRFIQWGRTFSFDDPFDEWKVKQTSDPGSALAQSPLFAPSVFNFFRPSYVPFGTDLGRLGLMAPELQITHEVSVAGYANFMFETIENGIETVKPDYSREVAMAYDANMLINHLNLLLTANQLETDSYELIVNTVDSMPINNNQALLHRVHAAVLMIMLSPDYLVLT